MHSYSKNILPSGITVRSIITIFSAELSGSVPTPDSHDFWELVYVARGSYNIRTADKPYELGEGELLIHAPNTEHAGTTPSDATIYVISFETEGGELFQTANIPMSLTGEKRKQISELVELGEANFVRTNDVNVRGMMLKLNADSHSLKRLKAGFELFLTELTNDGVHIGIAKNSKNYKMARFSDITEIFLKNVHKNLCLAELAALVSVSVPTLRQLCAIGCGESPMAYFISLKIKRAKEMIRESAMNFTEISDSLGFSSVHYFSKLFKQKVGMTPTEYARSLGD